MSPDYQKERDRMSLRALEVLRDAGPDKATQIFLGAIDALTVAVFAANGGGGRGAIGLAVDNTQPNLPTAA